MRQDFVSALLTTAALAVPMAIGTPATAQQNPLVGIWSTTQAQGHITAYVFFAANTALELVGEVTSGGQVSHVCGNYKWNQTAVEMVYTSYTPKVCALGACDPMVPLNQPRTLGYQIANGVLVFSDGSRYVRQSTAPAYLQPNGCTQ
jgi:hypothetical protein